jgi:large subunit ribosomal protein L15
MNLDDVHRGVVRHKKRRRIGRGKGSGRGKTAGRGHKGQRSHAGWSALPVFQGGAMPLVRRIPKRGFHNRFAAEVRALNVRDLERVFQSGDDVTPETLRGKALLTERWDLLKILGQGELTKKLRVCAHQFSQSAREKIERAGGEVVVLPGKTTVAEKKRIRKESAGASA